jgi:hypothetical protein
MAVEELPSMLNPFQDIYLLYQKKEGSTMMELRMEFLKQLRQCPISPGRSSIDAGQVLTSESCGVGSACRMNNDFKNPLMELASKENNAIPNVTFVIGGDETTLRQVCLAVKSMMPVVIVHNSGPIAKSLTDIYWKEENLFPRSCIFDPGFNEDEEALLDELSKSPEHQCLFDGIDRDDTLHDIKLIMRYRYYITILDFDRDRDSSFVNVIQALYKPFHRDRCISIALRTNRLMFLKTVFNREVDPEFDRGSSFASAQNLSELHAANLYEHANIFEITDLISGNQFSSANALPLVGRIVYHLLGYRYKLLYQEGHSYLDDLLQKDPRQQFWHLFLYCVLANKPEFAEYLLILTRAPVGSALLAYKLLRYMSKMAFRALENEKANAFTTWSERFEELAASIADEMYKRSRRRAYVSINRELPNNFGPYITPISMADDSHAMKFMGSSCCQTYLQRVWAKNMLLTPRDRFLMPFLAMLPILNLPFILLSMKCEETETPEQIVRRETKKTWWVFLHPQLLRT